MSGEKVTAEELRAAAPDMRPYHGALAFRAADRIGALEARNKRLEDALRFLRGAAAPYVSTSAMQVVDAALSDPKETSHG